MSKERSTNKKKEKQFNKAKNIMMTIYFGLGALFMLLMILIIIGILNQGEIITWFGF